MNQRYRSAFTLMELAIVLSIIGLIIGGVVGGRSLLVNMQIRKVGSDAVSLRMSMNQFQKQYGFLPGDFPKATEVWGRVGGGTGDCAAPMTDTASGGKATCNGDGSGVISGWGVVPENFRAFQHMANAGLIAGSYTGVPGGGSISDSIPGVNVPTGAMKGTGYFIYSWLRWYGNPGDVLFPGWYVNTLTFGGVATGSWPYVGVLTPKQAYNIDLKYDDGKPGLGIVRTLTTGNGSCVVSNPPVSTAVYPLNSQTLCDLLFLEGEDGAVTE